VCVCVCVCVCVYVERYPVVIVLFVEWFSFSIELLEYLCQKSVVHIFVHVSISALFGPLTFSSILMLILDCFGDL
jgi:hypothetical protein